MHILETQFAIRLGFAKKSYSILFFHKIKAFNIKVFLITCLVNNPAIYGEIIPLNSK